MVLNNVKVLKTEIDNPDNYKIILVNLDSLGRFLQTAGYSGTTPDDIIAFWKNFPAHGDKSERQNFFNKRDQRALLEDIVKEKHHNCVEYSILTHILLAQMGIPSWIYSARTPEVYDDRKHCWTSGSSHAFVLYPEVPGTGPDYTQTKVLDPALEYYCLLPAGGCYHNSQGIDFNFGVVRKRYAKPLSLFYTTIVYMPLTMLSRRSL